MYIINEGEYTVKKFKSVLMIFIVLIANILNTLTFSTVYGEEPTSEEVQTEYSPHAKYILMEDLTSGAVLFEQNADTTFAPGNLVKIVTAITVLENCSDLSKTVTVENGLLDGFDYNNNYHIGLKYGETLSVHDLLAAMLVHDATDCAIVLGHSILDSHDDFVTQMNTIAVNAGALNTTFTDTSGLDTINAKTTLRDMKCITQYALQIETFAKLVSTEKIEIPPTNKYSEPRILFNINQFISTYYSTAHFNGNIKGVKTYFNNEDDCGNISYYKNATNEILILCAKSDSDETNIYSYNDIEYLIDYVHTNFTTVTLIEKEQFLSEVKINNSSSSERLLLASDSKLTYKMPVDYDKSKIEQIIITNNNIEAPIKKGEPLGKVEVYYDGRKCGEVNLIAYTSVESSIFSYIKYIFFVIVDSIYFKIIILIFIAIFIIRTININRHKRKRNK